MKQRYVQCVLACLVVLLGGPVVGAVPSLINYQGILTDAQGRPLSSGGMSLHRLEFNIYADKAGAEHIWGPQVFPAVAVANGYFNVILGPSITDTDGRPLGAGPLISSAFSGGTRFIGIKIDDGDEVAPRQQILSAPYAVMADRANDHSNVVPAGAIVAFGGPTERIPMGWLLCDGRPVSRAEFPKLFEAVGESWGPGDGNESFHLPDLRGQFLRGTDQGAAVDPDVAIRTNRVTNALQEGVGGYQADELGTHAHQFHHFTGFGGGDWQPGSVHDYGQAINYKTTGSSGGAETRPKNAAVNYIIKY